MKALLFIIAAVAVFICTGKLESGPESTLFSHEVLGMRIGIATTPKLLIRNADNLPIHGSGMVAIIWMPETEYKLINR
jgi:hypothetical protein